MATLEECRIAVAALADRLTGDASKSRAGLNRSISCTVPDLAVVFSGRLVDGHIDGLTDDPAPRAQIRLTARSDDLVALTSGALAFGSAWSSGRLKVEASMLDLLKLRSLL